MILYHGATLENAERIQNDGYILGPVCLTPRREMADAYVLDNTGEGVVFELDVDESLLNIAHESYDDLNVALTLEQNIYTDGSLSIANAKLHTMSLND